MVNPLAPSLNIGQNGTGHLNAVFADLMNIPFLTVATLPAASQCKGTIVYVSNGAAGQPCLAVSDGTNWDRVLLGAPVSTTA